MAAGLPALGVFALGVAGSCAAELVNVGLFQGEGGATLGKKWMGLRVLDPQGRPLGWRRALARDLLYKSGSAAGLGAGFLVDAEGETWHDRASGCRVLEEEAPPAPLAITADAGRMVRT